MTHKFGQEFGDFDKVVALDGGAMLFDQSLCIGCRACQVACKRWNERAPSDSGQVRIDPGKVVPPHVQRVPTRVEEGKPVDRPRRIAEGELLGTALTESYTNPFELEAQTWLFMRFNEFGETGNADSIKWLFTRVACMHCVEAPCVYGCPTTALWKHPQGPVELRTDLCIGCRNCIETCPFDVPRFNEELGVVEKCTLCADRIANEAPVLGDFIPVVGSAQKGADFSNPAESEFTTRLGHQDLVLGGRLEPACVETCPTDALKWGPRHEIAKLAVGRAEQIGGYTYGINEVGGTNVIFVLEKPPEQLGLPKVYTERVSARSERLVGQTAGIGVFSGFVAMFGGVFKWVTDRKNKLAKASK